MLVLYPRWIPSMEIIVFHEAPFQCFRRIFRENMKMLLVFDLASGKFFAKEHVYQVR